MEVRGRAFGEDEDWLAYLRDAIARPEAHPEIDAALASGLSKIEAAAQGTPHAQRLADAALALLETGTATERDAVQCLALRAAPDAAPRLRALLGRADLSMDTRVRCAHELLTAARQDPVGLEVVRGALAAPAGEESRRLALDVAARHLPEWPANWLHLAPPDPALLLSLWKDTPVPRRRAFVEAVAAAGRAHLDALIAGARHLARMSREQAGPLMMMLAPYLPEPTSGEFIVEAMVGTLRAKHKDPRQAELAERVLSKHDLWPKKPDGEE
jgi:hypothetical protein